MNRLQSELHARRLSETREEEPEVLELCGVDVAHSLLSLSGIERVVARGEALINARYDQLLDDLELIYLNASVKLIEAQNRLGHRAEIALDRAAYAEEYGIDEGDDIEYVLKEGRWIRRRARMFPSSTYLEQN